MCICMYIVIMTSRHHLKQLSLQGPNAGRAGRGALHAESRRRRRRRGRLLLQPSLFVFSPRVVHTQSTKHRPALQTTYRLLTLWNHLSLPTKT
jgi:hypothetical protein